MFFKFRKRNNFYIKKMKEGKFKIGKNHRGSLRQHRDLLQTGAQVEEMHDHPTGLISTVFKQSGLLSTDRNIWLPTLISPINIHDALADFLQICDQ